MRRLSNALLFCVFVSLVGFAQASINTQAQLRAVKQADLLVENYRNALKLNDPVVRMNAALELQSNPMAIQRANASQMNLVKNNLNKDLNGIRDRTKALIRKDIAAKLGVKESDVTFFEATNKGRKTKGAKPAKIKVGQDWDVTVRVNGKDIPISQSRSSVEEAFYQACNNRKPKTPAEAKAFASKQYVEVTNRTHSEAYGLKKGEGAKIIQGSKASTDFDASQVAKVIQYKSDVPASKAEEVLAQARNRIKTEKLTGDRARQVMLNAKTEAVVHRREQCRQASKQFRNQSAKRVKALGGKVPKAVARQASIVKQMADGKLTYEQGLKQLKAYGTVDDAIRNMAELTESAVKLKAAQAPVASCQGLVQPKKKGFLSRVFSKGTTAGRAAKTTLMNSAAVKTALGASSVVLTGTSIAGTVAQGSLEEKRAAAKADRDYSYGQTALNVFKNTVLLPAKMITKGVGKTLGETAAHTVTVFEEEGEAGKSMVSTFGHSLVRLSGDFLDKRDAMLVQGVEMGTQLYDYASEDPVKFAGDVTMINSIVENATYDSQADRLAYRQLRLVGKRTQTFVGEKMQAMSRLQSQVDDIVFRRDINDPAVQLQLNELSASYQKLKAQVDHSKSRWNVHKAEWKSGDATKIVTQLDKNMGTLFNYTSRMPKDPVDYACKKQRQTVGPMKVSMRAPKKTCIKTKTYFSLNISGGESPYVISWQTSDGKSVNQTMTTSGSKSCWFRFSQPGDYTAKLTVFDSCAESQVISSESRLEVLDYHVALDIPKDPMSPEDKFTAQVKITGGTPPFTVSGSLSGSMEGRTGKIIQTAPETPGEYSFGISVTDAQGLTLNATRTLRVSESLNVIFTLLHTSVSPEKEFPAYITIKGGVPPYTLSGVVSEKTAAGVTEIRITAPKEAGKHVVALRVTDAAQTTVKKQNTLEVRGGFTAVLNPPRDPVAPGQEALIHLKINGGTPPFQLSQQVSGQLNDSSTQISWTAPDSIGPFPFGVLVTDSKGLMTMASCKVNIQALFTITVKQPGKAVAPNTRIPMEAVIVGGTPPFILRGAASGEASQRNIKFNYIAGSKPGSYQTYITCTDKTDRLARQSFVVVVGQTPQKVASVPAPAPVKKTTAPQASGDAKFVRDYYDYDDDKKVLKGTHYESPESRKWEGTAKAYFYKSGKLASECTYVDDEPHGVMKFYYESGQTRIELSYSMGVVEGPEKAYHRNGKMMALRHYVKGEIHGTAKTWYYNGQLEYEGRFEEGDPVGELKAWSTKGEAYNSSTFTDRKGRSIEKVGYDRQPNEQNDEGVVWPRDD